VTPAAGSPCSAVGVDAHHHFWQLARGDYGWLNASLGPIHRDFSPADLAPLLARHGIGRTILVQAAPTVAETRFLLALARRTPFVSGVVGWVDFEASAAPDQIASLAADPLLVGLRPMVQDIDDDDWLLRPSLAPAFQAMTDHGLVFDALVRPRHLPRLAELIDRRPDLDVVVDHAGKPPIREARIDPWQADLAVVARSARAFCKLSGLVTEARPDWTTDQLRPYADRVVELFGATRVLWGSDWPVVNLAGGYDRWRAATAALLRDLDAESRARILGDNAVRIYLQPPGGTSSADGARKVGA